MCTVNVTYACCQCFFAGESVVSLIFLWYLAWLLSAPRVSSLCQQAAFPRSAREVFSTTLCEWFGAGICGNLFVLHVSSHVLCVTSEDWNANCVDPYTIDRPKWTTEWSNSVRCLLACWYLILTLLFISITSISDHLLYWSPSVYYPPLQKQFWCSSSVKMSRQWLNFDHLYTLFILNSLYPRNLSLFYPVDCFTITTCLFSVMWWANRSLTAYMWRHKLVFRCSLPLLCQWV